MIDRSEDDDSVVARIGEVARKRNLVQKDEQMSFDIRNMTWSTAPASGVPAGCYQAVLSGIEGVEPSVEKGWGPAVKFVFQVTTPGEHKDRLTTKIVGIPKGKPGPGNNLGRTIAELLGGPPSEGQAIDLEACIGWAYTVVVAASAEQGNPPKIATIMPYQ